MRTTYMSFGALALAYVNANTYPNCEPNNCYRNMLDSRLTHAVAPFCLGYLDGSITDVPSHYHNCAGDKEAISSACSCIAYTAIHAPSVSSHPAVSTTAPYTYSADKTTSSDWAEDTTCTDSSISYEATVTPSYSPSSSPSSLYSTSYPVKTTESEYPVYSTTSCSDSDDESESETEYPVHSTIPQTPVYTTSTTCSDSDSESETEYPVHSTTPQTPVYTISTTSSSKSEYPVYSTKPETPVHTTSTTSCSDSDSESETEYPVYSTRPETPIYTTLTTLTTSSSKTEYTTSTIYAITEYTVTSCKPTVTNCPAAPHVTTETYILSTTVCPVASVPAYIPKEEVISTCTYYTTETYSTGGYITTTVYATSTDVVTLAVPTYPPREVPTYTPQGVRQGLAISTYTYYATEAHSTSGYNSTTVYPTSIDVLTIAVQTYLPAKIPAYTPEGPVSSTYTSYAAETHPTSSDTSTTTLGVATSALPTYPPGEIIIPTPKELFTSTETPTTVHPTFTAVANSALPTYPPGEIIIPTPKELLSSTETPTTVHPTFTAVANSALPTFPPGEILTPTPKELFTSTETPATIHPTFTAVANSALPTHPPGEIPTLTPEGPVSSTWTSSATETHSTNGDTPTTIHPPSSDVTPIVAPTFLPEDIPTPHSTLARVVTPTYPGTVSPPSQTFTPPGILVTSASGRLSSRMQMLALAAGATVLTFL